METGSIWLDWILIDGNDKRLDNNVTEYSCRLVSSVAVAAEVAQINPGDFVFEVHYRVSYLEGITQRAAFDVFNTQSYSKD